MAYTRTRATSRRACRWPRSGCSRPAIAPPPSSRRSCYRAGSDWRADSTSTTTRSARRTSGRRARRRTRRWPSWPARRTSRASCGSISTTRTIPMRRRSRTAAATRSIRISAKWRRWTSRSAAWSRRSSGTRTARRPSPSSRTTARGLAITARRSMATCCTSPRCTCRWCWSGPACRPASPTIRSVRGGSIPRSSTGRDSPPAAACD